MRTLFLFVFLSPFLGAAQDYIPMLQEGNTWSVDTFFCIWNPDDGTVDNYTITELTSVDNTPVEINGILYTQILLDGEASCLLREDNGFVYKYIPDLDEEKILFNLNVEIGDEYPIVGSAMVYNSCNGVSANTGTFFLEVMEIRTEFLAGQDRKVIVLTDKISPGAEDMLWIEGIGTRAGLGTSWQAFDVTCGSRTACFSTNGESYFMNGATSCDNTTLNINDLSKEEIILYPNPVTSISILQIPQGFQADLLMVYDISGKLIREIPLDTNTHIINHMEYASGLYFYKLIGANEVLVSNKFIIK